MSEEKKKGLFARLREGLSKTRGNMTEKVDDMVRENRKIDEDFYEELEDILLMADCGLQATTVIVDELRERVKANKVKDAAEKALNTAMDVGNKLDNFLGDLSDITSRAPSMDTAFKAASPVTDGLLGGKSDTGSENDSFHGKIDAVAYSTRPRAIEGSYMPCFTSLSDDNVFFYKWMFSKTQVYSGVLKFVVYSQKNKRSYKTVNFKNAYCTELEDYFNDHDSRLMHTRVTIAAEIISVGSNDVAEFNNDWT